MFPRQKSTPSVRTPLIFGLRRQNNRPSQKRPLCSQPHVTIKELVEAQLPWHDGRYITYFFKDFDDEIEFKYFYRCRSVVSNISII